MNKYLVKSPIKSGRQIHAIGAVIELSDEHAKLALERGTVALHDPRAQAELMTEAVKAAAALVAAGALTIDQAADQIASQAQGAVASQIRAALQDNVDALIERAAEEEARKRNEQEDADARKAAEEPATRERAKQDRKGEQKKK